MCKHVYHPVKHVCEIFTKHGLKLPPCTPLHQTALKWAPRSSLYRSYNRSPIWIITHHIYLLCTLLHILQTALLNCWYLTFIFILFYYSILNFNQKLCDFWTVEWLRHIIIIWRMKDQFDVTCYFISLIMCSTCFGH